MKEGDGDRRLPSRSSLFLLLLPVLLLLPIVQSSVIAFSLSHSGVFVSIRKEEEEVCMQKTPLGATSSSPLICLLPPEV